MFKKSGDFYDVAIIGGGISGLTAAALLSKAGLKVFLAELNSNPGGYLAKYEKNGYIFDTAIHWLNNCGPSGIVNKVFSIIDNDYPRAKSQKRIKRFIGENYNYLLTDNPDELKHELIRDFPDEKNGIEKFFNAAKKMSPQFNNFHKLFRTKPTLNFFEKIAYFINRIKFAIPFVKYVRYTGEKGKAKGLKKFFKSQILHDIFSNEPDILSCLIPIAWAYNKEFQSPPEGGSNSYAVWLARHAENHGCNIMYNTEAKKIIEEKGRCKAMICEHKGVEFKINCEYVISTCDLMTLYKKIIPKQYASGKTINKLNKAELYSSALIVNVLLNCPAEKLGFGEEIVVFSQNDIKKHIKNKACTEVTGISVFSQSARNKNLAPPGKGSLTIIIPAHFNSHNKWETKTDDEGSIIRGNDYKNLKEQYAQELIKTTEEIFSKNLSRHIVDYNVITPITFWRYTKNHDGTMMGQKPGKKNAMLGVARYKTPLKGLYISGHWAELGGGVPIAVKAAFNAVLMILKEKKHKTFSEFTEKIS